MSSDVEQRPKRKTGRPKNPPRECSVDQCTNNVLTDGLCRKHWQRRYRTGTTDDPTYRPRRDRQTDVDAILALVDQQALNVTEIARHLHMNPGTTRRLLAQLCRAGDVESFPKPRRPIITLYQRRRE